MFLPVHVALPLVKSGKLAMLAAGGAQRSPVTPEVPSLAESGVKDIDVDIWYALLGPPGLPADLVALLNADLAAILGEADVKAGLLKQGLTPKTGTPTELARLIDTDLERWRRVTREANIRAD